MTGGVCDCPVSPFDVLIQGRLDIVDVDCGCWHARGYATGTEAPGSA